MVGVGFRAGEGGLGEGEEEGEGVGEVGEVPGGAAAVGGGDVDEDASARFVVKRRGN